MYPIKLIHQHTILIIHQKYPINGTLLPKKEKSDLKSLFSGYKERNSLPQVVVEKQTSRSVRVPGRLLEQLPRFYRAAFRSIKWKKILFQNIILHEGAYLEEIAQLNK